MKFRIVLMTLIVSLVSFNQAYAQSSSPSQNLIPLFQKNSLFGSWSTDCMSQKDYTKIFEVKETDYMKTIIANVYQNNIQTYTMQYIDAKQIGPDEVSFIREVYKYTGTSDEPLVATQYGSFKKVAKNQLKMINLEVANAGTTDRKVVFKDGFNLQNNQPLGAALNCESDEMVQKQRDRSGQENAKDLALYKKFYATNQGKKFVDVCYPKIMAGMPFANKDMAINLCSCVGYEGSNDPNYISTLQTIFARAPKLNMVAPMLDSNYQMKFGAAMTMVCPSVVGK
jgi:hypothetical protein